MKLARANLHNLPADIPGPQYRRSDMTPGIVHIGVGNFFRAHLAWYLHNLMQQGQALDWAIIGAGVRPPHDTRMRERLLKQDCLTTLIELDPAGMSAEVIGSMIDYLPIEEGNGALIGMMADPAIRIVALTVTEGGYYTDPVTGNFDPAHPEIKHDAADPDRPGTAFGAMVAGLFLLALGVTLGAMTAKGLVTGVGAFVYPVLGVAIGVPLIVGVKRREILFECGGESYAWVSPAMGYKKTSHLARRVQQIFEQRKVPTRGFED